MNIEEIKKNVEKIEGWLSDQEGVLLYNLAKGCSGKGVIVEIGSWKGKSTVWLANGSKRGNRAKIYAIDPHKGIPDPNRLNDKPVTYKEFERNIKYAKVDDIISPMVMTSEEAAKDFNELVELIFIDGDHEYNGVKLDFDLWFPKVLEGGIMAFHDTMSWSGPKKVVSEFIYKSNFFKDIYYVDSITFATKVNQNNFKDRFKNRYQLLLKNFSKAISKLPLPKSIRKIGQKIVKILK